MSVEDAYNDWASQYDCNRNKTRDMEAIAIRELCKPSTSSPTFLEIGCGTGKNTTWLADNYDMVTSIDFSAEMLAIANAKVCNGNVRFVRADITQSWSFAEGPYDAIGFSLVLEHIDDLEFIFEQLMSVLAIDGIVYIGELHPFKQYDGTKARFETANGGTHELTCFVHHVSEFVQLGLKHGLKVIQLNEYFDDNNGKKTSVPRILALVLQR